jgi:hypothetical protein
MNMKFLIATVLVHSDGKQKERKALTCKLRQAIETRDRVIRKEEDK